MHSFTIPDDLRAYIQRIAASPDAPRDDQHLDVDGGRITAGRTSDGDGYEFTYVTADRQHRWEIVLGASSIRDIALGIVIEVAAERFEIEDPEHRDSIGDPLLVWGEYGDDALHVTDAAEVARALDGLHASAIDQPRMLRLWSVKDDQVIAIVYRDDCALYVVESAEGYATSCGEPTRADAFELSDHDGRPLVVPGADCVAWDRARDALGRFAERGELGPEIAVEGRIPSMLLMQGDIDRTAALAHRARPPSRLARSSLPRMMASPVPVPVLDEQTLPNADFAVPESSANAAMAMRVEDLSAWARRFIEVLDARALIELGRANLDEVSYQLGGLLQVYGNEAQHSHDTAEWLANEIGAVRGVDKLFATGGDLQIALRRSRP